MVEISTESPNLALEVHPEKSQHRVKQCRTEQQHKISKLLSTVLEDPTSFQQKQH
jgi:hypothetical protein